MTADIEIRHTIYDGFKDIGFLINWYQPYYSYIIVSQSFIYT